MAIEPDFSWTVNPINLIWSIGGALIAGVGIIWAWGRKWQTVESSAVELKTEIDRLRAELRIATDRHELTAAKIQAEIDMLKDSSATYREAAARIFASREELSKLEDRLWQTPKRLVE